MPNKCPRIILDRIIEIPPTINEKLSKYLSFIIAISFAHIASTNSGGGFFEYGCKK